MIHEPERARGLRDWSSVLTAMMVFALHCGGETGSRTSTGAAGDGQSGGANGGTSSGGSAGQAGATAGSGGSAVAGTGGGGSHSGGSSTAGVGGAGSAGTAGTASNCQGPDPSLLLPGECFTNNDCAEGICDTNSSPGCKPSGCTCSDGFWGCDDSCHLFGYCTPTTGGAAGAGGSASACPGENPAGCISQGCLDGYECTPTSGVCIPSSCDCDVATGTWNCTDDCAGGVCVPATMGSPCGAVTGEWCGPGMFCDFSDNSCGWADGVGVCMPSPNGCPSDCPGVCACDGWTYCNECEAHAMGVDIAPDSSSCID